MKRLGFLIGFGLLPFWLALAAALLAVLNSDAMSAYGVAIVWLVMASLPVSGATLLIAMGTLVTEAVAPGDQKQKLKSATRAFLLLIFIAGIVVGALWLRQEDRENDRKNQQGRAIEFVTAHSIMVRNGGRVESRNPSASMDSDRNVLSYEIETSLGSAIVRVVQQPADSEFKLECITTLSSAHRDVRKGPCEQGTVLTESKGNAISAGSPISADPAR